MKKKPLYLAAICVTGIGLAGVFCLTRSHLLRSVTESSANGRSNLRISPQAAPRSPALKTGLRPALPGLAGDLDQKLAVARATRDGAALRQLARQVEAGAETPKDRQQARRIFEEAAQFGDTEAKLRAGYYEQYGLGGPVDGKDAAKWYESAAADGDAQGYTALARMLIEGRAVPVDLARADAYLTQALSADDTEAMFLKGSMLLGTSVDPAQALDYLVRAATRDNADAQLALSRLYAEGKYLPLDPELAAEWAAAAEQGGSVDAKVDLANHALKDRSAADEIDSLSDGLSRLLEASDQKNARASLELAALTLSFGKPTAQDVAFARSSAEAAYNAGNALGAFIAAASYSGESAEDALQWLQKGAAGNDWRSKYALGLMDRNEIDVLEAVRAASKAAFSDFTTLSLEKNTGSAAVVPPVAISTPMPKFPPELLGLSLDGSVTAEFTVSDTGAPVGIQILSSSHPQLEAAARDAIASWTFRPAAQDGTAVPLKIRVPIKFRSSGGG